MITLSKTLLQSVLSRSLASGGDYSEIFCEDTIRTTLTMSSNGIDSALSGREHGLSLRVFCGLRCAYGYTNDLSETSIMKLASRIAESIADATAERPVVLTERLLQNRHAVQMTPVSVLSRQKAEALRAMYAGAQGHSPLVSNVSAIYRDVDQSVLIANSDGTYAQDRRVYLRATVSVAASDGQKSQSGRKEFMRQAGFEALRDGDPAGIGRAAADMALINLRTVPCPAGSMPVVIGEGAGGTFLHEACGHALEATAIARGGSYYVGRIGQKVASEKVTVFDSALHPNFFGSYNIDDEGVDAQQTLLIEKGILKGYLVDRLNGRRIQMAPTGNGRKQSYRYFPVARMSNTYIAPGDDPAQDFLAGIDYGLFIREIGGGNTTPATSEFSFSVIEGCLIRNGQLAEPVSGATIIGKASEALLEIDRVSSDLSYSFGYCGAASGNVPVGDGAPTIRVRKLLVGGNQ